MLLKVQFSKQAGQAKRTKKSQPTHQSQLAKSFKNQAYKLIVNSTGQWSEPSTSLWILASTNLSFKEAEVTK